MSYTIEDHKHRLAAWSASRAASVFGCRFSVEDGVGILKAAGFNVSFSAPTQLPACKHADSYHREWREKVIAEAEKRELCFTHGVAAKLINCYLKVRFVCGGHESHPRVASLHPPIDKLLLTSLATSTDPDIRQRWKAYRYQSWSKFESETYEEVVYLIRNTVGKEPMWSIEEYWRGYQ